MSATTSYPNSCYIDVWYSEGLVYYLNEEIFIIRTVLESM